MTMKYDVGRESLGVSRLWEIFVKSIFSLRHGWRLATIHPLSSKLILTRKERQLHFGGIPLKCRELHRMRSGTISTEYNIHTRDHKSSIDTMPSTGHCFKTQL